MDDSERAAYLTTAKVLFHSTQAVRSHRDVDLVGGMFDMEKSLHEMVVQRLDECAREGEFKFEFKERLGLRPVKILSNDKVVRALYKNGSVFCEDGETLSEGADRALHSHPWLTRLAHFDFVLILHIPCSSFSSIFS